MDSTETTDGRDAEGSAATAPTAGADVWTRVANPRRTTLTEDRVAVRAEAAPARRDGGHLAA